MKHFPSGNRVGEEKERVVEVGKDSKLELAVGEVSDSVVETFELICN